MRTKKPVMTDNDHLLRQFADGLFADTLHIRMKLIVYEDKKKKLPLDCPKHIRKTVDDFIKAGDAMQQAMRLLSGAVKRHSV